MPLTTFGDEFKKIQNSLGLTNEELAERVYGEGSSNTSVVSKLRGYVYGREPTNGGKPWNPKPNTLKRFFEAMGLPYHEQVYLYGLAGMIPKYGALLRTDVKKVLDKMVPRIESHPYPAYVLDLNHFRFWVVNGAVAHLVGGEERLNVLKNCSVFDLVFSSKWGFTEIIAPETLKALQESQVRRFKLINLLARHEPFYMSYPERLKETLDTEEYKVFEDCWNRSSLDDVPLNVNLVLNLKGHKLSLNVQSEPVYQLGFKDFFTFIRYYPLDSDNEAAARKFFDGCEKKAISIWEMEGATAAELLGLC